MSRCDQTRADSGATHSPAIHGSISPRVLLHVFVVGLISALITGAAILVEQVSGLKISLAVAPFEFAGAVLGLLLVLRTNAGYDRCWEARKLWGGIVNQSRNFAISALSYGPKDQTWQDNIVRMDRFGFMQVDRERARLIDHIGACDRILKTPIPRLYAIKIRRFIAMFLLTLPFALLHDTISDWLVPFVTMLVAYPLFSLDQIGLELQNPFAKVNLSHLPLDDIATTIEENLTSLLTARHNAATEPKLDNAVSDVST